LMPGRQNPKTQGCSPVKAFAPLHLCVFALKSGSEWNVLAWAVSNHLILAKCAGMRHLKHRL
jgi:hypothetical protein